MRIDIVPRRATNDADVRLWFRPITDDDRTLGLHEPSLSECPLHRLGHEKHRRPVRTVLRLFDEQQPIEQLDRIVLIEEPVVDQPRILVARPAMQDGPRCVLHGMEPMPVLARRSTSRN